MQLNGITLTAHVFSLKITQSSGFEGGGGEKLKFLVAFASFYSRRKPTQISSKFSGHEKEKFEFGLRNFGSRDAAYVCLSDTHHRQIIDWKRLVRHKSERLGPQTSKYCLANE